MDLGTLSVKASIIYIIEFDSKLIKVGFTTAPKQRLQTHKRSAEQFGAKISRYWVSADFTNVARGDRFIRKLERSLINFCLEYGNPVGLDGRGEYFDDVDYLDVRQYAETLGPVPSDYENLNSEPRLVCEGCEAVNDRPITAHSVFHLVDIGQLRLIDSRGQDVTKMWWTGKEHNCRPRPDFVSNYPVIFTNKVDLTDPLVALEVSTNLNGRLIEMMTLERTRADEANRRIKELEMEALY